MLGALVVYQAAYPWRLSAALLVCGAGNGMVTVPFFAVALARLRPHRVGWAAGLLNVVQQFGATLGSLSSAASSCTAWAAARACCRTA